MSDGYTGAVADILQALLAEPADDTAWLALADALAEQGQDDRAELTRLVYSLRRDPHLPDRPALEDRLQALLAAGVAPVVPELVNSVGLRLALIPPGVFLMGSAERDQFTTDEVPRHEVEITRPFFLGRFAVTQNQYRAVVGVNPSRFRKGGTSDDRVRGLDTSQFPVESIDWSEAVAFCDLLSTRPEEMAAGRSYRLATEAEWEYACRAGTTTPFYAGEDFTSTQANFDGNYPGGHAPKGPYLLRTTTVGSYLPNAFGLYDMLGNVYEWCEDWYAQGYYERSPRQNPTGPKRGRNRVVRGGSWIEASWHCRCAERSHAEPTHYVGFRVATSAQGNESRP